MRAPLPYILTGLALGAACRSDSAAGRAAESIRVAFRPTEVPPDTLLEMLHYAADLQVNVSEMARLPEGVLWIDLTPGEGVQVAVGDSVQVALWGWLPDGTPVDSALATIRVGQGQVLEGIDLGIPGMKTGGRRQLVLPPGLAYGTEGGDRVAPNAVLVYLVELRSKVP